jgi:thiosulfate/3-mercaptopyruvate sulfurtransferase
MNYTTLISAEELYGHEGDANIRIIDCRFNLANLGAGQQAWQEGHIPGALYAHLERDMSGEKGEGTGRHPAPDRQRLADCFRHWGINTNTQIIAYDAMGGAMAAARLWWLSRWLGHSKVAVLDGGFPAWLAAGGELDSNIPDYAPGDFSLSTSLSKNITVEQLQTLLAEDAITLIDARDASRFRGEQDTIDSVAGHVPGAVNHFFMQNLNENGRFKKSDVLKENFSRYSTVRNADKIVHMCGSGVTACHNLLAMQHAGMEGPLLYAGSWSEWIRDAGRPIAKGDE